MKTYFEASLATNSKATDNDKKPLQDKPKKTFTQTDSKVPKVQCVSWPKDRKWNSYKAWFVSFDLNETLWPKETETHCS